MPDSRDIFGSFETSSSSISTSGRPWNINSSAARVIRIGTMDLKIAAIVLAHDATLLTKNLSDFRKVPGSKVADWTLSSEC